MMFKTRSHRRAVIGIALLATVVGLYVRFERWQEDWYRSRMPPGLELADALLIDGDTGFRSACGVAMFALTPAMQARLRSGGAAALAGQWQATPYVETGDGLSLEDRWQTGMSCAHGEPLTALYRALASPGSYVEKRATAAVVVSPAQGFAALVYFD